METHKVSLQLLGYIVGIVVCCDCICVCLCVQDSYPRYLKSDLYKNLLAKAIVPQESKKRYTLPHYQVSLLC